MKIIITRSFERTRQIADFVPIKAACEATAEIESGNNESPDNMELVRAMSQTLDDFVQSEVEKSLMRYRPVCIRCGGKKDFFGRDGLTKEGMCPTCNSEMLYQAKENAETNKRNRDAQTGK